MARILGPRNKRARYIGEDLGLRTKAEKLSRRLGIPPGQHGPRGRRKTSDYSSQLKEKQKAKFIYGVMERQFRRYVKQALKAKGETGITLLQELETRLDNVLYRLSLAPTRAAARQLVNHGHVKVNQQPVTTPSYRTRVDDIITLNQSPLENRDEPVPTWLERQGAAGKVVKLPQREDIPEPITEQLIVEFYSR